MLTHFNDRFLSQTKYINESFLAKVPGKYGMDLL